MGMVYFTSREERGWDWSRADLPFDLACREYAKPSPAQDHVSRRRTYPANPSAHGVGSIDNCAFTSQTVDIWRIQIRVRIVGFQVEWRLIIGEDEKDIWSIVSTARNQQAERQEVDS